MLNPAYEIAALALRYVFLLLVAIFTVQIVVLSVREYRALQNKKRAVSVKDAGFIELTAPRDMLGKRFTLYQDTTIGKAKRCDIFIEAKGLANVHAAIYKQKDSVLVSDYGSKAGVILNGTAIKKKDTPIFTGDRLKMGEIEFIYYGAKPIGDDND